VKLFNSKAENLAATTFEKIKMNKISSFATAQLLIINAALYGEEKSKEISRYRFSRQSLRNISGWGRLSSSFIEDLMGDLQRLG
jgi:hypothetical protein